MAKGLFIVIEGIDGTGKTTQSKMLGDYLTSLGREVIVDHEPTQGPWGRKLRESAVTGRLPADQELEWFIADRREHVNTVIAPALAAGKVVILDRYYFSNMAYQGARGLDPEAIRRLNEDFAPVPDRLILLDLAVDESLRRIGVRGDTANEFEHRDNLQRCREIFLTLAREPFTRVIDAQPDASEVSKAIREAMAELPQ